MSDVQLKLLLLQGYAWGWHCVLLSWHMGSVWALSSSSSEDSSSVLCEWSSFCNDSISQAYQHAPTLRSTFYINSVAQNFHNNQDSETRTRSGTSSFVTGWNTSKLQRYLLWWTKCFLDLFALQDPAQVSVGHLVHGKAGKHKTSRLEFMWALLLHTGVCLTFKLRTSINITLFQKHGPEVEAHHWNGTVVLLLQLNLNTYL